MKRKIAVFTGTRAEYGLLYWLMKAIQTNKNLELQVIVSGAHLSPTFGETWKEIERDGFAIDAKVNMQLSSDTPLAITKSMSLGLAGCGKALEKLRPDILVVLGDRYEAFAAAQAAMIARVPIAHIHGGESTEGLIDEAIRHSMSKMSHLHFVATEPYRKRVIQLGENPDRVWVVGAPGLDNIAKLLLLSKQEMEAVLGLELKPPVFLVTYHPVTLQSSDAAITMRALLGTIDEKKGTIVITGVNADTGNHSLRKAATEFAETHANVTLVENLGTLRYLSLMRCTDAVVGNSSSGLIEAPAMGIPSINIGDRQRGRLSAPSVIHCAENAQDINRAVALALSEAHKKIAAARQTPYGTPGSAERIEKILASFPLEGILTKRFYDLP